MNNDAALKVIEETDKFLTEKGWCQHVYYLPTGEHCTMGALQTVHEIMLDKAREAQNPQRRWWEFRAAPKPEIEPVEVVAGFSRALNVMSDLVRADGYPSVIDWNDRPERSVEDVHLLLKRATERLEECNGK